ncbi:MAG TPA: DUF4145 domain-containing protein [Methanoregula sp.]|nr:DUF4145 domain-containing protein [Methanoregula sp.]
MPGREEFFHEMGRVFTEAQKNDLPFIEVRSGDLHKKLGGYPGRNHQMPLCCDIMRQVMEKNDQIIMQPPKGRGANLIIRYYLPRKSLHFRESVIDISSVPESPVSVKPLPKNQNTIIELENPKPSDPPRVENNDPQNIPRILFEKRINGLALKSHDLKSLQEIVNLMEVNPESALIKIRSIAEKISRRICNKAGVSTENMRFSDLCPVISERKLLSAKGIVYLNNIRIAGNAAAHPDENASTSDFSKNDVLIYGQAIIEIIDEALKKDLM